MAKKAKTTNAPETQPSANAPAAEPEKSGVPVETAEAAPEAAATANTPDPAGEASPPAAETAGGSPESPAAAEEAAGGKDSGKNDSGHGLASELVDEAEAALKFIEEKIEAAAAAFRAALIHLFGGQSSEALRTSHAHVDAALKFARGHAAFISGPERVEIARKAGGK